MSAGRRVPGRFDLVATLGESFGFTATETPPTYFVAGRTIAAAVYASDDLASPIDATALETFSTTLVEDGQLAFSLTKTQIAALGLGAFAWWVTSETGPSDARTPMSGTFEVKAPFNA